MADHHVSATVRVNRAPVLTLCDFDWGCPAPGAWVTWDADDPARRRRWDPETARTVRACADR